MALEVSIQKIAPRPAAVVEFTAPMSQIGQQMGQIFGEIMAYLQTVGMHPAGPPFSAYPDLQPNAKGDWRVITGFPVMRPIAGNSRVKAFELTGGDKVAVATHIGPYDTIEHTYVAIQDWMKAKNLAPDGPMWESYLTDPAQEPDSSKWRTVIYCPVK